MRVIPAPDGLLEKPKRSALARATAKGARVERLAVQMFEALDYQVERAQKVVRRVAVRGRQAEVRGVESGTLVEMTLRHDFFGVWDLIAVKGVMRRFVQVTDEHNRAGRRAKILASGFPVHDDDLLLAYAGRRRFRVFPGPLLDREGASMYAPKTPKRAKSEKGQPELLDFDGEVPF